MRTFISELEISFLRRIKSCLGSGRDFIQCALPLRKPDSPEFGDWQPETRNLGTSATI